MIEKIFKAYDVRATYPNPLNEESAWKVGHATAQFLKRSREKLGAEQRVKNENTTLWSARMFPIKRSDSEIGRAMWLMSSITSISGASHRTQ